jgi:hypothetical protein
MNNLDALNALDKLSELGKKQKEIKVGDMSILLSTLDTGDETDVFVSCSELTGNAYFYTLKLATLKYAIRAVNGNKLDSYLELKDLGERQKNRAEILQKISDILKKWDEKVITYLYTEWAKLSKESEDELEQQGLLK